jgi:alpha-D-ribose 1-methylphosphonate 5-triphosphate synthase subunit PhnG
MCEPTTLTALSTFAGNLGFQQTAATFATMAGSSTAVAIGQGISSVTGVLSSPLTSMGLSLMQGQATRDAAGAAAAQNRYQQTQYRNEIERERLEILLAERERKRRYLENRSNNLAQISSTGVEIASESYKRFFASARETYLRDRDAIGLRGLDEVGRSADLLQVAKIDEQANLKIGKTKALKQITDGMITTAKILEETPTG